MATELLHGLIIENTPVFGKMGSKMDQQNILMGRIRQNMEYGKTVKTKDILMVKNF